MFVASHSLMTTDYSTGLHLNRKNSAEQSGDGIQSEQLRRILLVAYNTLQYLSHKCYHCNSLDGHERMVGKF